MACGAEAETIVAEMTDADLDQVRDLVYERSNLCFLGSRGEQLRRCVLACMNGGGHAGFQGYYQRLASDSVEFGRLISRLTTKETYFFRQPEQFEALSREILPGIVQREGRHSMTALARGEYRRMRLSVWSAGCATGQELYSLAMQILDSVAYSRAWQLSVLGTDIDAAALDAARQGRYEHVRLDKVPPAYKTRFFREGGDGTVGVTDDVKAITECRVMNLKGLGAARTFHGQFDVIFCRNVMIYFDYPAQQRLVTDLEACLRPGGVLFTGEGEVLHLYRHGLETVERGNCIFYRRPEKE